LIGLEGVVELLALHPLKQGLKYEELRHDAACCPQVDGGCVVAGSQEQLGGPVGMVSRDWCVSRYLVLAREVSGMLLLDVSRYLVMRLLACQ
jgi:hypothetical protein